MNRSVTLLAVWVAMLMPSGIRGAAAKGSEHLYVISGTPGLEGLPVRLYSIDSTGVGTLTMVAKLADELNSVLVDYSDRELVVASPAIKPTRFSFIGMDKPDSMADRMFEYDPNGIPSRTYLLSLPDRGLGIALVLSEVTSQNEVHYGSSLSFVALDPSVPTGVMPFESLKYVRYPGESGVVITQPELGLPLTGNPLHALAGLTRTNLGIAAPPYIAHGANSTYTLIANDDAFMLLSPFNSSEAVLDILNKSSNTWRRIPLPFKQARLRAFGHWLAAIELRQTGEPIATSTTNVIRTGSPAFKARNAELSPGAAKRVSEEIGPAYRNEPAPTADDLFDSFHIRGLMFPGELALYNLEANLTLRISTSSGDSEVILVNDDTVFYRVDDAIFRRDIHGSTLGEPVKLAEGIEIVQVHWGFLN